MSVIVAKSHASEANFDAVVQILRIGERRFSASAVNVRPKGTCMNRRIAWKSTVVALASMVASLLIVAVVVPLLGGVVDGNAWLMSALCPLVIAWPASAQAFWKSEKLKRALDELAATHRELAAAHQRLTDKAARDDMTGMLNRESFFAALDQSRRRSDRGVLLLVDADHFKRINDNWGHLVGDDALLAIAAAIGRGVRAGDTLGRIGGEEFGVFLAGATEAEAQRVAERIRREVEMIRFRPTPEREISLTVSLGGTLCPTEMTVSNLMRAADRRLYEAKRTGRNRVVLDDTLPTVSVAA
jgi:diguanylate cyclase (GGDEF)-like protein